MSQARVKYEETAATAQGARWGASTSRLYGTSIPYSMPMAGDENTAAMPALAPAARHERRASSGIGETCHRAKRLLQDAPIRTDADSKPWEPPKPTVVAAPSRRPGSWRKGMWAPGW